jgi:hypothetical protein
MQELEHHRKGHLMVLEQELSKSILLVPLQIKLLRERADQTQTEQLVQAQVLIQKVHH